MSVKFFQGETPFSQFIFRNFPFIIQICFVLSKINGVIHMFRQTEQLYRSGACNPLDTTERYTEKCTAESSF